MGSGLCSALVFSYDFHAGAETMYSRHFNDPAADSYFTKRKWGECSSLPSSLTSKHTQRQADLAPRFCTYLGVLFFFLDTSAENITLFSGPFLSHTYSHFAECRWGSTRGCFDAPGQTGASGSLAASQFDS